MDDDFSKYELLKEHGRLDRKQKSFLYNLLKGKDCTIEIANLIEILAKEKWVWSRTNQSKKDVCILIFNNIMLRELEYDEIDVIEENRKYKKFIEKYESLFKKMRIRENIAKRIKLIIIVAHKWDLLYPIILKESRVKNNPVLIQNITKYKYLFKDKNKLLIYGKSETFFKLIVFQNL